MSRVAEQLVQPGDACSRRWDMLGTALDLCDLNSLFCLYAGDERTLLSSRI